MASYVYEPLPNESAAVRLIQICPDDTQVHGFSLIVQMFTLKEVPAFCCLSYTWQSAKIPEPGGHGNDEVAANITVNCGDQTIGITENLFDSCAELVTNIGSRLTTWDETLRMFCI